MIYKPACYKFWMGMRKWSLTLAKFKNAYLLNMRWHVAAKSAAMIDVSVGEWKRNVQNFVPVVTPAATVVRCDFMFLLEILSANHKLCLWHITSIYFCSLEEKSSSHSADYLWFNQRWVATCWMALRKNGIVHYTSGKKKKWRIHAKVFIWSKAAGLQRVILLISHFS